MTPEVINRRYFLKLNEARLDLIITIVWKQIDLIRYIILLNLCHLIFRNVTFLRLGKTRDNWGPRPNYARQWGQSL